jgi:dimethylhistidine N-methyltransferase
MAREVLSGLSDPVQKWVPPTYFYDREGSEIYEEITELPEYYPTRTEAALLRRILPELRHLVRPTQIVELGSGSSTKTRLLFEVFASFSQTGSATANAGAAPVYIPIDVSRSMLERTARRLVEEYPPLRVLGLCGQYEDALPALPPSGSRLVVFLGGTIGNFTPAFQSTFFTRLGLFMRPGNQLLLGFDRRAHKGKPASLIVEAYNDRSGVTARFNLNLLRRLNRELGADFDLSGFAHRAIYSERSDQIEMHLISQREQMVHIPNGGTFRFRQGETLLTELSRKFDPAELAVWFARHGFHCVERWTDDGQLFGLMLLEREEHLLIESPQKP